jgi:monothiol glutaredoxin
MSRPLLSETSVHSSIRAAIDGNHRELIDEVIAAVAAHPVVVVGMKQNPFPKRACKLLREQAIEFHYLEYGSYFSSWRPRTALKMWSGWPTFPMIFVNGTLVGGAQDLEKLVASGELKQLLGAQASAS